MKYTKYEKNALKTERYKKIENTNCANAKKVKKCYVPKKWGKYWLKKKRNINLNTKNIEKFPCEVE